MSPSKTSLAVGIPAALISLGMWVGFTASYPDTQWWLLDLSVYRGAADSLKDGEGALYTSRFGFFPLPFFYPPFAALVFRAVGGLEWPALKVLATSLSLLALFATVWASWSLAGLSRRLGASLCVFAIALWLEPVQQTLGFGQVNLWLLGLCAVDLSLDDRRAWKGAAIGLSAGFKLAPALFVIYLLLTRRFRAAAVACGVFALTVLIGWLALPSASHDFWFGAIKAGGVGKEFISNQSLYGFFLRVVGREGGATTVGWLISSAVIATVGLLAARRAAGLLGVCLTAAVLLLVSPIAWTHHWVWVVPVLVWLLSQQAWVRSALVTLLFFAWPMRIDDTGAWAAVKRLPHGLIWKVPHNHGRELQWSGLELLAGNFYLLTGLTFIAVMAWKLFRAPPQRPV